MIIKLGIVFLFLAATFVQNIKAQATTASYNWKYLDFQFPTQAARDSAIYNRQYIKGNSFPIDIDVYNNGATLFVTMPRIFDGTPITLGTITGVNSDGGPLIAPFPNYNWQIAPNCTGFTSVFRVAVDEYKRLWVLDSGVIDDKQVCPAQLVVFELSQPGTPCSFIHKFHESLYRNMSLFITPIVDARNGYDTMVYIADVTGFGIIVYDHRNNKSWRVESQSTHLRAISQYSNFLIAGESFNLMDGNFGMAISPKRYTNRQLFSHSLASITQNRISLSLLDNPNNWPWQYPVMNPNQFVEMGSTPGVQGTAQAMDYNGNLFFGSISPPGIGCWDSATPYTNANQKLVLRNDATLQFVSGLKIVTRNGVPEVWTLSCRFQKIMAGTRNINEINYRVQAFTVNSLLGGKLTCR